MSEKIQAYGQSPMTKDTHKVELGINGKPRKTGARVSKFIPEITSELCERLTNGESLRGICRDKHMPDVSTVMRWIAESESFASQYARARAMQAEIMAAEIVALADAPLPVGDSAAVQLRKLQIDARKWTASKLIPKRYGDRVEIDASDETKEAISLEASERRQLARALLTVMSDHDTDSAASPDEQDKDSE